MKQLSSHLLYFFLVCENLRMLPFKKDKLHGMFSKGFKTLASTLWDGRDRLGLISEPVVHIKAWIDLFRWSIWTEYFCKCNVCDVAECTIIDQRKNGNLKVQSVKFDLISQFYIGKSVKYSP